MKIKELIHDKEHNYLSIMKIVGVVMWIVGVIASIGIIFIAIGIGFLFLSILESYFKAVIYGNSVKVTEKQYPDIYKVVKSQSEKLNMQIIPDVFICNGNGLINFQQGK